MLHKLIADNAQARATLAAAAATKAPAAANGHQTKPAVGGAINLDDAYLSGVLAEMAERTAGNVERVNTNTVPVINRVSAGYPKDFTDMSYPPRVADDYIGCPDVHDRDAFAARVSGDSMRPKYGEGDIVVFSPAAQPKNGDDCFVRFGDGQTTFKRVFFESDEAGDAVIRLQPRNERYRPKVVKSEDVAGLYKAVYRYQRVDDD
jgi:SOS-response transcriptional repressor LexA